ncbi:MAG: alpha/beta fold hydrolase [Ignavibacteriales bacterium]|nr:alpha/beta fold hydrolase [Ignavibacteriales bacterium]
MIEKEELRVINGAHLFTKMVGHGQPIVVVHGGPGLDHSYLLPQMKVLANHYRLIFFDIRASGRSSVEVDSNSMTLTNFVEDIEGIRQSFGIEKMNLMGHSWGGLLSMSYAVKYTKRLNSLLLINTAPASSGFRDQAEAIARSRITKEDCVVRVKILRSEEFRKREPEAMAKLFRIAFKGSFYEPRYADSLTLTFQPNYARSSAMLQHLFKDQTLRSYDLHKELTAIQCPTFIIGGDYDQVTREMLEKIQGSIRGSKLVILKNCGHFPYIECQEDFVAAIKDFLQ